MILEAPVNMDELPDPGQALMEELAIPALQWSSSAVASK